tara:strand:- start:3419 stop:4063 length:645 start_codon:yes stop_codon:yes gene_type:complete
MKLLLSLLFTPILIFSQNNAELLNGNWNIISLEYSTLIDVEIFQQDVSGEASDAGVCYFNAADYTYSMDLNFDTEPLTISIPLVGDYEVPSFPVENSSAGTWSLIDNDDVLLVIDSETSIESSYEIIALTDDIGIISGTIPFSQEISGMAIDLEIDVEMILEKNENNSLISEFSNQKTLIKTIDLLGREMCAKNKGMQLEIYDDGSIVKKYLVN